MSSVPATFVVFDLETTGLDADRHEIIEIAAIRVNRDSTTHDTFQAFIRPRGKVPARITEITGITQAMLDETGEDLASVLEEFRVFIGDHPLVAFNAEFDAAFLSRAAKVAGSGKSIANPVSCALLMARMAWPGRRSYKLKDLAKDGNLDMSNTHRALGDCQRTMIVYGAAARVLGRGTP
jgi:DNA polymerase III epsilon subunit family exonuclease